MSERLFFNGNIITICEENPYANYIYEKNGYIENIGIESKLNLFKKYKNAEKIDLGCSYVVPGFIDSHMHMLTGALTKLQIDLNDKNFKSITEVMEYIESKVYSDKAWVRAFGFTEESLDGKRLPTAEELDAFFPNQPVIITRVCGHVSIINTVALQLLDKDEMEKVKGGEFLKDEDGNYTGIITEMAQQFTLDIIPSPNEKEIIALMEKEQEALIKMGICSIHDAGTDQLNSKEYIEIYKKFNDSQKLKIRTYLMARPVKDMELEDFFNYVKSLVKEYTVEKSRLFFGAIKLFADGSLGGKTAAVYDGYVDDEKNKGLLLKESLDEYIPLIHKAGLQVAVHAIGDRSTEYVADLIIEAKKSDGNEIRHRIEHAELLDERIIKKLADNKISIMTQPRFISEFGNTYMKNIGADGAMKIQPIRSLLKSKINLGFGTDYPVIDPDPLKGIDTAVRREIGDSAIILNKDERIKFNDALRCYTLENAYGACVEEYQGSLEKGKFADFVVINYTLDDRQIGQMCSLEVTKTVIGGETLFQKS